MSDPLRDRIARTVWISHRDRHAADIPIPDWAYAIADAVIAELGDWVNWIATVFVDFGLWLAEEITGRTMTRIDMESCLTDWKADDE